ncbi:MAG: glycosyltransferase family 2 protein, partial [Bacteroidales bacterium]|nr:glycosyltransferase family 2 protein [Bacteroidales bacterium]
MKVSIFIPTYNATGCIGDTLQSVLAQTYKDIEVWVVDDCSPDNTVEYLKEWQQRDERVHVLAKEKNEGFVPYSWVRVFPLLKGEFTLYMSHDDYLSPDCIELLVKKQQETGADCIIPDCVFTYDDGSKQS